MKTTLDPIRIAVDARRELEERGFAWIPASAWTVSPELQSYWQRMRNDWEHLELDGYLKGGATFRRRRYGRFRWLPFADVLECIPVEPYFQPADENGYAGGISREFAPLLPETSADPFLSQLIRTTFSFLPIPDAKLLEPWEVRVHQIRVLATPHQIGEPSPEGIHQDGTDFLTLHLVRRDNVDGGHSTIYDLEQRPLFDFTFREPLDSVILEDPRIMHGVTPVHPADGRSTGVRDILGIDFICKPARGQR